MAPFIIGLFLLGIGLALLVVAKVKKFTYTEEKRYSDSITKTTKVPNVISALLGLVLLGIGVLLVGLQSFYSQGPGEASVIKSFTGQVVGLNDKSGFAAKAPWDDTIKYNILNQQVIFSNPANVHKGQENDVQGGEITITDKEGVSANVDVAVRLSIRGDKVVDIYNHYGDEKSFENKLVTQDVRAVVREVPNQFNTIDVLTKRSDVETEILKGLQSRWEKEGVQVDSIALQDIRYPDSVKQKYADAQNARTAQSQAQAELETTKINAQQQVVQAQAQADANRILSASLTPEILRQRELDALKDIGAHGNLVVTDGSSAPLLNVPAKK
jgi:regulator of protease activity HflC (stomatin/prohibitin superfamily)